MTRIQFHPILSARENLSRRILPVFHPSLFKSLDGPFQWWFWSHAHLYISDHSECWIGFTPTTLALGAGLWWAEPRQTPPPARPQSRWSTGLLLEERAEAGRRGRVRALERCCRTPHTPSRSVWGGTHNISNTLIPAGAFSETMLYQPLLFAFYFIRVLFEITFWICNVISVSHFSSENILLNLFTSNLSLPQTMWQISTVILEDWIKVFQETCNI